MACVAVRNPDFIGVSKRAVSPSESVETFPALLLYAAARPTTSIHVSHLCKYWDRVIGLADATVARRFTGALSCPLILAGEIADGEVRRTGLCQRAVEGPAVTRTQNAPPPQVRTRPDTSPPPLPVIAVPPHLTGSNWPWLWWVGCHGGAGVTTLTQVTGIGADGGMAWPAPAPDSPTAVVILVCRATARGTWAATGAVEQSNSGNIPPNIHLAGVVTIPASGQRPPRIATERLRLLAGWAPALWRVGWVEDLATDDPRDVGRPSPDMATLQRLAMRAVDTTLGRQVTHVD